jgi:hypothetical protein
VVMQAGSSAAAALGQSPGLCARQMLLHAARDVSGQLVFYFYICLSFHSHEQVYVSLLLASFTTRDATLYLSCFFFYVSCFLFLPLRFITARSVPQKLWAEREIVRPANVLAAEAPEPSI